MSKYILNIVTGTIHSCSKPCYQCKKCNEENKKYFEVYEDAVNFYEGKNRKGTPCGVCLKEKRKISSK